MLFQLSIRGSALAAHSRIHEMGHCCEHLLVILPCIPLKQNRNEHRRTEASDLLNASCKQRSVDPLTIKPVTSTGHLPLDTLKTVVPFAGIFFSLRFFHNAPPLPTTECSVHLSGVPRRVPDYGQTKRPLSNRASIRKDDTFKVGETNGERFQLAQVQPKEKNSRIGTCQCRTVCRKSVRLERSA